MSLGAEIERVFELAGPLWCGAYALSFASMWFESARPRAVDGQSQKHGQLGLVIVAVGSLVTPFLLLIHAVWATRGLGMTAFVAGTSALLLLILPTSFLGWFVSRVAPNVGGFMHRVSPAMALFALVLTIYATWPQVLAAFESLAG